MIQGYYLVLFTCMTTLVPSYYERPNKNVNGSVLGISIGLCRDAVGLFAVYFTKVPEDKIVKIK